MEDLWAKYSVILFLAKIERAKCHKISSYFYFLGSKQTYDSGYNFQGSGCQGDILLMMRKGQNSPSGTSFYSKIYRQTNLTLTFKTLYRHGYLIIE